MPNKIEDGTWSETRTFAN